MSTSPGLFSLTRRRFATPRSAALVIVALTAFAAFVIAAAPRALVEVVRAEVSHQIQGVAPTGRDLTATLSGVPQFGPATDPAVTDGWDPGAPPILGELGQALADNRAALDEALQPLVGPAEFAEYAQPIPVNPVELSPTAPVSYIQLLTEPRATDHLTVIEGAWPLPWEGEGPVEIALTLDAATTMQWQLGEERGRPAEPSRPTADGWAEGLPTYRLVALVEAMDPDADRWLHLPTALTATVFDDGNRRPTATSVAWLPAESWAAQIDSAARPAVVAWYPVDGAAALSEEPTELLAALRGATSASVPFDTSGQYRARFSSDIVGVLSTALSRAGSASAILAVAAVGPLAVSVALVVLASALMIRRRRADLTLMSARGAPLARLRGLLFWEGVLLGVPAAILAAATAVALTPFDAGPLPTAIAVLVGLAPALALAFTLRPALLEHGRADLDAPVRSRAARLLGWVVILLAAIAVALLVIRGIGPATEGIDPLVVAAPLLATVALALVVVRLHPLPIAAALRAARRGRGATGLVGAARNLRDPAAGTTAVLAMLVAVAIAVFSSLVLATVDRGAVVAAQRAVGADIQLSGPYFVAGTIDRMRDVVGVEDAVGVLRGDYLTVAGPDGQASVLVIASDVDRLADVQSGMVGAVPGGAITPGAEPRQIIESSAVADEVGSGDTTFDGSPATVVATVERILGMTMSSEFVLVDQTDYTEITGLGFFRRTVLVDVSDGADPAAVAGELSSLVGANHSVTLLEDSTAEIRDSPAVSALRTVLLAALAVAVGLSVVALLLVAGVSRDARSRVIALLRSMGMDRRGGRGIVAWEFVPLGVTALVGGVLLGAVLPLLVVTSIDLRPFTGGGAQPSLTIDPVLSGILIATVVVALGLAVVGGVVSARTTSMATVLRTEED